MDLTALRHAKARLVKATEAVAALQVADTFDAVEAAWTDFLISAATIYSKLEQGAKINGKSNAWFGRVKKVRKDDQLLSYMHHARNSDEHGIQDTSHRKAVGAEWVYPDGQKTVVRFESPDVILTEHKEDGKIPMNRIIRYTDVVRVHDNRYNDLFDPPTAHLGEPLGTLNPVDLARIALPYLQSLVGEAGALLVHMAK